MLRQWFRMNIQWGSKTWEVLVALLVIFILAYGGFVTFMDLINGHPLWWYNLSFILFALSSIGLLLLVREAKAASDNVTKYGRHPDYDKYLKTATDVPMQAEGQGGASELTELTDSYEKDYY